jgi:hypothetical protein
MNIFQNILSKNGGRIKYLLILFFALAMIWDLVERYHYRAELNFRLKWVDIEYLFLLLLIFMNPKGIRIIVVSVFLVLIYFSTVSMFFYHMSNLPHSLILRNIFSEFNLDSSIVYIVHMALYLLFIYSMIKTDVLNHLNDNLLDQ